MMASYIFSSQMNNISQSTIPTTNQLSARSYLRIKKKLANKVPSMLSHGIKSSEVIDDNINENSSNGPLGMDFNENLMNIASQMRQLNAVKDYFKQ